eukprot:3703663-Pleurochrysis_carterae.AAC.2
MCIRGKGLRVGVDVGVPSARTRTRVRVSRASVRKRACPRALLAGARGRVGAWACAWACAWAPVFASARPPTRPPPTPRASSCCSATTRPSQAPPRQSQSRRTPDGIPRTFGKKRRKADDDGGRIRANIAHVLKHKHEQ